jgi:isopropylmalate/homocitrate/citramalate synthase/RimJ/RimL family protein N-acetyltransferase
MSGLDRSKVWTGSLNARALEPQPRHTIGLYDTTLRDGEQSVGVVLMPEEKLEIARALDAAGIDRIEAGFPRVSDDDWRAVELIAGAGLRAEVWGFSRAVPADVEALVELGVAASVIESPISDAKLAALGVSRDTMLERIAKAVSHAAANGIKVAFFGVDSSRADLEFYRRAYAAAVEAGAREVVVVDTIGIATPEAAAFLVGETVDLLGHDIPVHWHGHDDFGLATAAAVAAVQAGATWVQGTVNGMGERAGNADLIEVALALEALYGIPTRLDLTRANELARLVQERAGTPLAPWKAVTGDNLFVRESGAVAAQFHDPPAIEPYASELVGQGRGIVLGKKSGIDSVRIKAAELGLELPEEQRPVVLAGVKRVGTEKRGLVTDEEFTDLVAGKDVRGERIVFPTDGLADDAIRVRLPRPDDAPSIVRGLSDKQILRGTGIVVMYELTEEAVVERITTRWPALRRTGDVLFAAIADLETDAYLGNVQLHAFAWDDAKCEVGYWVLPEARGRGVAARATRLLSVWAIETLGMERVEATSDFDNAASVRTLERAGFTQEGTLRNVAQAQRGRVDAAIFSLLRVDVAPRRRRRTSPAPPV